MELDTPALGATGLRRFLELRSAAVESVVTHMYASDGGAYEKFGARGREACREDLAFHLEFLRPVLEFGLVQPMVDYLRWLARVLETRGVPAHHLALSLDGFSLYFAAALEEPDGRIVGDALARVKAWYLEPIPSTPRVHATGSHPWPECEAFESALVAGDRAGAAALFHACLDAGRTLVEAESYMILPALRGVGRRWQDNELSVAQEHLATAIAQSLMTAGLGRCAIPALNGKTVLLACVEGNNHSVGLQMVADAFLLEGWNVQYLGASVPTAALVAHVGLCRPHLLGLSVSFAHQLRVVKDIVARNIQAYGDDRPPVIVGGLAINQFESLAGALGADAWSIDAPSAVVYGAGLAARPATR